MTIVEFLLARIAEDEARAQAFEQNYRLLQDALGRPLTETEPLPPQMTHGRILAECEAKRRIVEEHLPVDYSSMGMKSPNACHLCGIEVGMSDWEWIEDSFPCATLRALAVPYADHPDYDETWRP